MVRDFILIKRDQQKLLQNQRQQQEERNKEQQKRSTPASVSTQALQHSAPGQRNADKAGEIARMNEAIARLQNKIKILEENEMEPNDYSRHRKVETRRLANLIQQHVHYRDFR